MAIKAIINNTEKEIEQIKNSDEQDVDYVYSRIGDTEVEGEPSISIKSIGENLANYRIYGNTVDGESVGDRTGNLFDGEIEQGSVRITDGAETDSDYRIRTKKISVKPITTYTISSHLYIRAICLYNDGVFISTEVDRPMNANHQITLTMPNNANQIQISFKNSATDTTDNSALITPDDFEWGMLNYGSEPLPYEPYGYRVPVTVSNGTDTLTTPIYLPEQIKKVGDVAEYIDYGEQKMHRIGADDIDVTLPALSTIKGTNILSVNTSIQPSNIYVKDNFDYKKVFTATRVIEDELPLSYRSIEDSDSTLSNYRIYGNTAGGESVGDLETAGEHAGEYKVAVKVEGKNLAPWDKQWALNVDGLITANNTSYASIIDVHNIDYIYLFGAVNKLNSGIYRIGKSNILPEIGANTTRITSTGGLVNVSDCNYCLIACQLYGTSTTSQDLLNEFMITAGDTVPTKFEPYHTPVTNPIYLPEPIKMIGDEAEYIDFKAQKQYFADGTSVDVELPALPTIAGTNVLAVGTEVQPSSVEIKGHIK